MSHRHNLRCNPVSIRGDGSRYRFLAHGTPTAVPRRLGTRAAWCGVHLRWEPKAMITPDHGEGFWRAFTKKTTMGKTRLEPADV